MMKPGMILTVPSAVFLWGTVHAGEKPSFREVDRNDDGVVSIEEAKNAGIPEAQARKQDLDNDGKLSKEDWRFVVKNPEPPSGQGGGLAGQPDSHGGQSSSGPGQPGVWGG